MALTNAEFLQTLLAINDQYATEHPQEEELLTPKCKQVIAETLKQAEQHGNNPAITNLLFNQKLKPNKK